MSASDYAILVGIDGYPELGENNSPLNLRGPGNDVDAVKDWLLEPEGGGLPAETSTTKNIFVVKSVPSQTAATASPTTSELDRLFAELDAIARANRKAGKGSMIGRRVYIYMSGHGFSPGRQRACLYTADASERLGMNVHATGWLNWLQDAGYFREYVLWIDACMNRQSFLAAHDPPLPIAAGANPPLASFVAYAAQRPLKAVEVVISEDEGRVHGAFTWTLLQGLRGAAADVNGRVTGRTLADWLRNAQAARFDVRDREDRDVAQEPEIIQEDAQLIFSRGVRPPVFAVSVSFPPAAVAMSAQLWSGAPPAVIAEFVIESERKTMTLRPGLYVFEVPDAGLRQGFEVVQPLTVSVDQTGPPVTRCNGDALFRLVFDPGDSTAEIFIVDGRFALVDCSPARLSTILPPGLFKLKSRIGNAVNEKVILLDGDLVTTGDLASPQRVSTVIPLPDTAASHEYHQAGRAQAIETAVRLNPTAGQAVIMIMVRTFSGAQQTVPDTTPPWQGVSIVAADGATVVDLEQQGQHMARDDPYAYAAATVPEGAYYLRQRLDNGHIIEQSLIACAGWRSEVFVLRRVVPGSARVDHRPRVTMMMRRVGDRLDGQTDIEDRITETAKQAMANERRILNASLEETLMLKFRNPVAGIIGGHLLLIERERDPSRDMAMLGVVVGNLRSLLGDRHPDVEALALQCKLPAGGPLLGPPLFQRSWALLTDGARQRPGLVPADMWARVQASSTLPPFMVWSTNEGVKTESMRQLASVILGPNSATMRSPVARTIGVAPAAAMIKRTTVSGPSGDTASPSRAARSRAAALNVPPSAFDILKYTQR